MELLDPVLLGLVSFAFAAGGAWSGVRYAVRQLRDDSKLLRKDVDRAHTRIDTHDQRLRDLERMR